MTISRGLALKASCTSRKALRRYCECEGLSDRVVVSGRDETAEQETFGRAFRRGRETRAEQCLWMRGDGL